MTAASDKEFEQQWLAEIGRVVVASVELEKIVATMSHVLIADSPRVLLAITTGLDFKRLVDLAFALYLENFGKDGDYATLKKLLDRASKAYEKRNSVVHGSWYSGGAPGVATLVKASTRNGRGLKSVATSYKVADLAAIANEMIAIRIDHAVFLMRLYKAGKVRQAKASK